MVEITELKHHLYVGTAVCEGKGSSNRRLAILFSCGHQNYAAVARPAEHRSDKEKSHFLNYELKQMEKHRFFLTLKWSKSHLVFILVLCNNTGEETVLMEVFTVHSWDTPWYSPAHTVHLHWLPATPGSAQQEKVGQAVNRANKDRSWYRCTPSYILTSCLGLLHGLKLVQPVLERSNQKKSKTSKQRQGI